MKQEQIIQETENFVAGELEREGSGHDWFHIERVRKLTLRIGQEEKCDLFIAEMAALLHDLDDWKLISSSEKDELGKVERWLSKIGMETETSSKILQCISDISFRGAGVETPVRSFEAAVVQDADRLDAMGAIGIARTFAYGGHKSRLIYDPKVLPVMHSDFESYQKSSAPTINHFYEKLLLLKDRMNTQTARYLAEERHQFMEIFLTQFFEEWESKK
jgi:uncharacterized protein